ncbi:MAG TPA: sulfotransferase, partial [Thermoanaerobaculia bacterium]|nr:sulfotransferase [Thermoanaerobaculia bacterium]
SSCVKSTSYYQAMPMLDAALRRHYPNHTLGFIDAWEERTADMLRFERQMGSRAHRLRYEDLVREPESTLAALFSFLGVAFDPGLIDQVFVTEHRQRPNGGDWRAYVSTKISDQSIGAGSKLPWHAIHTTPLAYRERMNARLEQLGYPRVEFREDGFVTGMEKADEAPFTAATLFEEVLPITLEGIGEVPEHLAQAWVFAIEGENGGSWTVDLSRQPPTITEGVGAGVEARIAAADLEAVINGRQPPAYLLGRVQLGGGLAPEIGAELLRLLFAA